MVVSSELLSRAAKEVQIADHLLAITYRFAGDIKILFRVMAHACNAIDDALEAVDDMSIVEAIPSGNEALDIYKKFTYLLNQHDEAPVVFRRKRKYVIANDNFSTVSEVRLDEVRKGMQTVKQFIFQVGKHVVIA